MNFKKLEKQTKKTKIKNSPRGFQTGSYKVFSHFYFQRLDNRKMRKLFLGRVELVSNEYLRKERKMTLLNILAAYELSLQLD